MTEATDFVDSQNQNNSEAVNQTQAQHEEKLLRQSEVNALVKGVKNEAYEKGKRDAMMELEKMQQQNSTPATTRPQNIGGIQQPSHEDLRKEIRAAIAEETQLANSMRVANDFVNKLKAAESNYEDFGEAVYSLKFDRMPEIVHLANSVDNTADVVYDLAQNPRKLADLKVLFATDPDLALREMTKLSKSIKQNKSATQTPAAKEPLSRVQASTVGADNGKMEIRDLRKLPKYRG